MNEIIREIGSYKFCGFYESPFLYSGDFMDMESEDTDELKELTGIKNLNVYYEYEDIKKYKLDVSKCFMEHYINKILEVLPNSIIDKEFFKLEIVENSIELMSPKYYNYTTDKPFINIITNIETLNLIKWYTLNLKGAQNYLINNHSSCSGFISFIKNDLQYWKETPIKYYETNYLTALFDMLLMLNDPDYLKYSIIFEVREEIDKYEYVHPVIYHNNNKIELSLWEFEEKYKEGVINEVL